MRGDAGLGPMGMLIVGMLLAGCADPAGPAAPEAPTDSPGNERQAEQLGPPALIVGQSWAYRTQGFWDTVGSVTVVVLEAGNDGYLLGAATTRELVDEIAWDLPYLGSFDGSLRPLRDAAYGSGPHPARLLDFPLSEGRSWQYGDIDVVASRADVSVPGGTAPGFVVHGESDTRRIHIEYAESVGFLTKFEDVDLATGEIAFGLRLERVGNGSSGAWFERGQEIVTEGALTPGSSPPVSAPTRMSVSQDDDAVIVWALGPAGGTAVANPPPGGQTWHASTQGERSPVVATLDAMPGSWDVTAVPEDAEAWVYVQAHAVRWLEA